MEDEEDKIWVGDICLVKETSQIKPGQVKQTPIKKNLADYNYYVRLARQVFDYEATTEFIINHIKKMYKSGNDIGTELKKLKPMDTTVWRLSMEVSVRTDIDAKEAENQQFKIKFKVGL